MFLIGTSTKSKRWEQREKYAIRMFLLSHLNTHDKDINWKSVSKFLQTRSSTQVRTHIQKFRVKVLKQLKEIKDIIRHVDEEIQKRKEGKSENTCFLPNEEIRTIEFMCKDYLLLLNTTIEYGTKYTDAGGNPVTYEEILIENQSIPSLFAEIGHNPNKNHVLDDKLERMFKNPEKCRAMLEELQRSLEHEDQCSAMKPERVKRGKREKSKTPIVGTKRTRKLQEMSREREEEKHYSYSRPSRYETRTVEPRSKRLKAYQAMSYAESTSSLDEDPDDTPMTTYCEDNNLMYPPGFKHPNKFVDPKTFIHSKFTMTFFNPQFN